jgi:hypothetical protein
MRIEAPRSFGARPGRIDLAVKGMFSNQRASAAELTAQRMEAATRQVRRTLRFARGRFPAIYLMLS